MTKTILKTVAVWILLGAVAFSVSYFTFSISPIVGTLSVGVLGFLFVWFLWK